MLQGPTRVSHHNGKSMGNFQTSTPRRQNRDIMNSSNYTVSVQHNEFAHRLKKDSILSHNFDPKHLNQASKKAIVPTKSRFSFRGNQTGNYRVVLGGRFVMPPNLCFQLLTLLATLGPSLFQLFYN